MFGFNCPPLLKQWLDEVLVQGWAFGTDNEYKLKGKKKVAISAGIDRDQYQPDDECQYTMEQFLAPFEFTYKYVKADYRPHLVLYGLEFNRTTERLENSAIDQIDSIQTGG
ncbi:flavodoxin family protein [Pedobacter sp. G11]|uniref:NAD(P)H-dependent oxidoreductase n=1 Tax=Pedobacter sp. G11 TaxID=2482728 RepID=UPI000F5DE7A5|nr:NAD(P)H-dependent oxidoreductase [Pedobacter sp. G11]AZI26392.1 flavodoxin family protein [Pedobacter sp. G11]